MLQKKSLYLFILAIGFIESPKQNSLFMEIYLRCLKGFSIIVYNYSIKKGRYLQ